MNNWKKYIKTLRSQIQGYYKKHQAIQAKVEAAEQALEAAKDAEMDTRAKNLPRVDIEIAAQKTKIARMHLQKMQDEMTSFSNTRWSLWNQIEDNRKTLSAELDNAYAVDAAQVDPNVVILLNSGVCKTADYEKLYQQAKSSGNTTMMRVIAKSAEDYAEKVDDASRSVLNAIYADSENAKKDDLRPYDEYCYALKRATGNPESIYRYQENHRMYQEFLDETSDIEESED